MGWITSASRFHQDAPYSAEQQSHEYPNHVTSMRLAELFDFPILAGSLPLGLKELFLGSQYDCLIQYGGSSLHRSMGTFPASLKRVRFSDKFNHELLHLADVSDDQETQSPLSLLPPGLKCLKLGKAFNKDVSHLPLGPERLSLGLHVCDVEINDGNKSDSTS